jgi:hypothetical protein
MIVRSSDQATVPTRGLYGRGRASNRTLASEVVYQFLFAAMHRDQTNRLAIKKYVNASGGIIFETSTLHHVS